MSQTSQLRNVSIGVFVIGSKGGNIFPGVDRLAEALGQLLTFGL
jgi:hypothetical protein